VASSAVGGGAPKQSGAEADTGAGIEHADGGRIVEQRRTEPGQSAIADVERLAGI
jgi:hypothetical protein